MIPLWKVTISYLTAEHAGQTDSEGRKKILSSLSILKPGEVCTETYLVVDAFNSEIEASNMYIFLCTRLVRFLLLQLTSTQHISKDKFKYVPLQDFTPASDIDRSMSEAEIDQQLYAKYGLDQSEIDFIESKIKSMEKKICKHVTREEYK